MSAYQKQQVCNVATPLPSFSLLTDDTNSVTRLQRLFLYPVKSCGAQEVSAWPLLPGTTGGFLWDRTWLVTKENGAALTLKQEPRMVLLRPRVDLAAATLTLHCLEEEPYSHNDLCLSLHRQEKDDAFGVTTSSARVCGDRVPLLDCGEEAARWLSDVLRRPGCRLARRVNGVGPERRQRLASLANESHFLLLNVASLRRLRQEMPPDGAMSMDQLTNRFRANLVVAGGVANEPLIEETWQDVRIGAQRVPLRSRGVCTRCQVICVDECTGETTREPMTRQVVGALKMIFLLSFCVDPLAFLFAWPAAFAL